MTADNDTASLFYPSHAEAAKAPPPATQSGPAPAGASDARAAADLIYPGAAPLPPGVPGFDKLPEDASQDEVAAALYNEHPETMQAVKWDEPAAPAGELEKVIADAGSTSETFDPTADLPTLANAFAAVGVGQTFAREAMMHAVFAASDAYQPMEPAEVMQELRKSWGKNTEKNIARAQAAVRAANDKDPRVMQFLNQTGLGNDLAFIKKIHASLQRRRR